MPKILLIDDDPGIIEVMTILLKEQHFEVFNSHHEQKLLSIIHTQKPDLILLDLWISGMDGREVFQKIQELQLHPKIPILITSAKNDALKVADQLGADGFIPKPFDIHEFIRIVKSHLSLA